MTRTILSTIILLITLPGFSQVMMQRIDKYVAENKIDTFIVYTYGCEGAIQMDSCQAADPHYLFWKQKDSLFLKRFDYCYTYQPVPLDTANPLNFYLQHRETINREEIRKPEYREVRKIKNKTDTVIITSTRSHSCIYTLKLPLAKKSLIEIDMYDLYFEKFDNGRKNMHFAYNQKTRLKELIEFTESFIRKLQMESKFEKE